MDVSSLLFKLVSRPWILQKRLKFPMHFLLIFYDWRWNNTLRFFLCRIYIRNRAAGKNLTVVSYCLNQFQEPENDKKWLKIVIFSYFLPFLVDFWSLRWDTTLRFYTTENRPGGEHLLKILEIFHISHTRFQGHKTGKKLLKIVSSY